MQIIGIKFIYFFQREKSKFFYLFGFRFMKFFYRVIEEILWEIIDFYDEPIGKERIRERH